jgi:hypothetical protein
VCDVQCRRLPSPDAASAQRQHLLDWSFQPSLLAVADVVE